MVEQITVDNDTFELLNEVQAMLPKTQINRTYDEVIWMIAKEYLSERKSHD